MQEVGEAAAEGGSPGEATFLRLRAVATSNPLRTEPFLVEGALAERAGDYDRANKLLAEARARDPRSAAARYLYADTAVRQGKVVEALKEMAVLSRLVPGTSVELVPALAQFAQSPGSHEKLASILAQNPQLKTPVLNALSANPQNAELVTALAGPTPNDPGARAWQSRLLNGLVAQGHYQRAYGLWRRFAQLPREAAVPLLFNGSFRELPAPPPFNWDFNLSDAGIAEPGKGNLRVLFYGRQDATLATQLLLLPPGAYRLQSPIMSRVEPTALSWVLTCAGGKVSLLQLPLNRSGSQQGTFTVPETGCRAQQLQLNGKMEESPQDIDVEIGPLQIERLGA